MHNFPGLNGTGAEQRHRALHAAGGWARRRLGINAPPPSLGSLSAHQFISSAHLVLACFSLYSFSWRKTIECASQQLANMLRFLKIVGSINIIDGLETCSRWHACRKTAARSTYVRGEFWREARCAL